MPDKKNEPKKSGLRGIFERKESPSGTPQPAGNAENKPEEQQHRPPTRRTYTPRYAERDMILSVPVEDRPDLVAKAKERSLKRVCSDIGFSAGSSSRSTSSHARSASLNLSALSTHPNLHISRNASIDPSTPGSSGSSIRSLAMQRYSSMSAVPLQQSANAMDMQWRGLAYNGPPAFAKRPRPRTTQSMANIPTMIPESQIEHMQQAFHQAGVSEDSENVDNDTSSRSSTPSSGYTPEVRHRPTPAPVRQRSYFSHRGPLPDLRTKNLDKGKGKEQAGEWDSEESRSPDTYSRPAYHRSNEAMSGYIISTKPLRPSQIAPTRPPPPPPPHSNSDASVTDSPKMAPQQLEDFRTPSLTESDSNGTDESSYHNGSHRNSSVSTNMTAPSDSEDVKTERTVKVHDGYDDESDKATPCAEKNEPPLEHVLTAQEARVIAEGH